ncbi:MBL fold metallo-hydrolase [Halomonas korlensis]|uniref:Glyoxylase, beta-lactamase superfamily II n=1 Tax=Halomonas korlensis TaxID=463301 RepID=A0A1I7IMU7_9GAMM|nr:MBL fold metallo-hydrolase [Halomonas korlensis]SFU74204.1 Glyoxylase, beta-lactamase superfamily II [Halomonas korlensis]
MEIRPAATLALVRDAEQGLEILLLQRTWEAVFLPGYFVFPGGAVDARDTACQEIMTGIGDASISQTMSLDEGGADYLIAAVRECFEEAGLLLAVDRQGRMPVDDDAVLPMQRDALNRAEVSFFAFCRERGLSLPLDRLAYLGHWVTPKGPPRRFDTRFFVTVAPDDQRVRPDGAEVIDHAWLRPQQALEDHRCGRRQLSFPTRRTLRILADFDTTDALMRYAHATPPEPSPGCAWPARKGGARHMVEPDSPAFEEVRTLDPLARGIASAEIVPGVPVRLAPGVVRLTAPNPGMMTGPGTNTYLLGDEDDQIVIDPGPDDPEHLDRLLEITGGRISRILVTHTHRDHSPGAALLKERTGAVVAGMPPPTGASQDQQFSPDQVLTHGEIIATPAGALRVIHTPGHASNHLCYLLQAQGLLFSGDHVMQGSTVVINPPDGNMAAYLEALDRLMAEPIVHLAPGHGFLMGNPQAVIDFLITHRLAREHKVARALSLHGPASLSALTRHAYDDAPETRHPVAERSALAHLLKLEAEGCARRHGDEWSGV